jgi:hypothetical protein
MKLCSLLFLINHEMKTCIRIKRRLLLAWCFKLIFLLNPLNIKPSSTQEELGISVKLSINN